MKNPAARLVWSSIKFLVAFNISASFAGELSEALRWWEPPQAFLCAATTGDFPSKFSSSDPSNCDDGDMTLFNGLLCQAGDQRGCDAVRLAQGADGRWWRSPRRIGWTSDSHPGEDVSFSLDQALGVMLYVAKAGDLTAFDRWVHWLDANRPCLTKIGDQCLVNGWVRFCTDDADKRCTARPGDCAFLEATGRFVGSSNAGLCSDILRQLHLPNDWLPSVSEQVLGSASANTTGFPLHLAAVQLLLARTLGLKNDPKLDAAGKMLILKQSQNPFFQYLADGVTPQTTALLLQLCPSAERPSKDRNQWSWERDQDEKAWLDSMYWDCIFLGKQLAPQ